MAGKVKVGIIGSRFEADIHAAAFQIMPDEAEVVAVASPTPGNPEALAQKYGIPRVFHDYRAMLKERDIEMVTIAAPNGLHARMTIDTAHAGKHVVCEKPLCMTLEEADEMIDVCRRQGVLLMYAEELLFTPKYVQAKRMADEGAFRKVYLVKQSEKHFGPHGDWFWDVQKSGGGVFMDMGCHGIAFCYWFLNRPVIKSVYCEMGSYVHGDKTRGEDNTLCILEFDGGAVGLVENSWARRGGMDDRVEVYGEGGLTFANLLNGQRPAHLQRVWLRLRHREGTDHQGLVLPRLRGALELRLPPRRCTTLPAVPVARRPQSPPARTAGSSRKFSWPAIARPGWA